jgi:lysophospholipid acyltransferase (LPLAT)-like uncharacterized protein
MMHLLDTWWRRIRKSDTLRNVGCWLLAQYIWITWRTGRWEIRNAGHAERLWREGKPFIISFWHGRMLILPAMWPTTSKIQMLISMHRDGELIARAIGYFGHGTVRGSAAKPGSNKDRGGVAALRGMLKTLKGNGYVGITPDGPRGPRMRATDGIVTVARMSGVPILPCSFSARSRVVFNTWDRFVLPLPFSRGVIVWGEPIFVPREAEGPALEAARATVEAGLTAVTNQADEIMGVATVEPDPVMAEGAVA